ncbi:nicotinate-nucleotide adenylyltransferase [Syntrophomonas erecta]
MNENRLGIIGGTFDPIHYGHLVAAEGARHRFNLDRVVFVPAARPPHKNLDLVSWPEHRYEMVKMAVEDNPSFEVSRLELERKGRSYTIDTIDTFKSIYPGYKLYFIMGVDSLFILPTWKDINRLSKSCVFIVVTRPGYKIERFDPALANVPAAFWENAFFTEIPGLQISSTDIRRRVNRGEPIRYLLPACVESYIYRQKLYNEAM